MRAYLDGRILDAESGAHWLQTSGTDPYELRLELEAGLAADLHKSASIHGSTLELDCTDEGLGRKVIERLTIIGTSPTRNPHTLMLIVRDFRWTWEYGPRFKRSYNVRRKTGQVRRIGQGAPIGAQQLADDVAYATWSLQGEKEKWEPEDAVKDILDFLMGDTFKDKEGNALAGWVDEDSLLGRVKFPALEGLEVNANPDIALAQIISALGGRAGVYPRDDGWLVLHDRLSGGEASLVGLASRGGGTRTRGEQARPRVRGTPLWTVQDRRMERPCLIRVLFTRAVELRIDHREDDPQDTGVRQGALAPRLDNVLSVPEDITIGGKPIVITTYVKVDDYLAYLTGKQPSGLPPITKSVINKGWLHGVLEAYADPIHDPSGVWGARIPPIRQSYRADYQLREPWRSGRIRSIKAYQVSIEDQETLSKAPSPVYMDWAVWQTWRGAGSKSVNDQPRLHKVVRNRFANKNLNPNIDSGGQIIDATLNNLQQAPATLTIKDQELGIFGLEMVLDHTGHASRYVRSALTKASLVTDDPSDGPNYLQEGELRGVHEFSVVVTVTPSAPNDARAFHVIEVTPQDVFSFLPAQVGDCDGPVMDIYVEPTLTVARIGWSDERAAATYAAFAATPQPDKEANRAFENPLNLDELNQYARAEAARVYLSLSDHIEGGLTTGFDPTMNIMGTARAIRHEISPGKSGGGLTSVELPPEPPRIDLTALMPRAIRALVEGHVQE